MKEIQIETTKTARIYLEGNLNEKTDEVLVVLHGYAQLAQFFIKRFESISNENRVIIAPEGLSKFYWQGMNGRVVASWMTKEDRINEIKDQITYLDKVYNQIKSKSPKARISVLGFSQGTATGCRWIANSKVNLDRVILWAGGIPEDVLEFDSIKKQQFEIVIGTEDEYISEEKIEKMKEKFSNHKIKYELTKFKGGHIIKNEILFNLFN